MSKTRLPALIIILIAFAIRIHNLDLVWHDFDPSYPHGLAIETLESILAGHYQDPTWHMYMSTNGLPNPLGTTVLWSLVGLIERSPYVATALCAMANVLAVAMTYDLARRLFGRTPAAVASFLFATSTWSIFIARSTNLPGLLEFSAVATAWLLVAALQRAKGQTNARRLVAGYAVGAVVMHTYMVAIGLVAQLVVIPLVAWSSARHMRKALAIGAALTIISVLMQLSPLITARLTGARHINILTAMSGYPYQSPSIPNPFGIHLNLSAFDHALRLVSGRDFENTLMDPKAQDFPLAEGLGEVRAGIVDALILIGAMIALARSRRDLGSRMILAWFLVPTVAATILMALYTTLQTTFYYLPLASPGGYILAGMPFMLVDRFSARLPSAAAWRRAGRIAASAVLGLAFLAQLGISAVQQAGYDYLVLQEPQPQEMPRGPLRWQLALGNLWRSQCSEVDDSWAHYWLVSILQTTHLLRDGASRANDNSSAWAVSPNGGNCTLNLTGPAPQWATRLPSRPTDRVQLDVYRSLPITPETRLFPDDQRGGPPALIAIPGSNVYKFENAVAPLQVNLYWSLLGLTVTPSAQPSGWITVSQATRIDQLPDEPYSTWYFAPFVTLRAADGKPLAQVDNAMALQGSMWRAGDIVLSTVRMQVPPGLAPGAYDVEISLFDPNQRKNAVFFAPDSPGKPIIALTRQVKIVDN